MTSSDVVWREYNIHEDDDDDQNEPFDLFQRDGQDSMLQDDEFLIPGTSTSLKLTCQDDYMNSTGMSIWRGSEVLAEFLIQNPTLIQGKTILELGAGVGLCGLVARHLGASRVIWTDGDMTVLENLRRNVARNWKRPIENNIGTTDTFPLEQSCPQLIWGKHLDAFQKLHGINQVILGTDLFYMTKSLDPLWKTVDRLLRKDDGVFVAVNTCASQSPMDTVFEVAERYGFEWATSVLGQKSTTAKDEMVYLFKRRRNEATAKQGDTRHP